MDQFGNSITLEQDGLVTPTAIVSADGIRTELSVDSRNHLTRITFSDGNFYGFEYTPDGLMLAETEPEGNRFVHIFDDRGRLTDVRDEEGGRWIYTRSVDDTGNVAVEMTTAENNITLFSDYTDSTGAHSSIVTDASGAQINYSRSDDGLSINKSLPCGTDVTMAYDTDPQYKFKYLREMTETMPSGLARVSSKNRSYADTNTDNIQDLITETITVNNRQTRISNNVLAAQKMITSTEGR